MISANRRHLLRQMMGLGTAWQASLMLPFWSLASGARAQTSPSAIASGSTNPYQEISWDSLISPSWAKEVQAEMMLMGRMGGLKDGSEAADKALASLRKKWDEAPIVKEQLGQKVRLPGFVVPLDARRDAKRDFLLVPYFGACIHTPPPPANQIVLVSVSKETELKKMPGAMETVWVDGLLEEARVSTAQGVSGYRLVADRVLPYTRPTPGSR